jgi:ADP-ribose pyrophosphatase
MMKLAGQTYRKPVFETPWFSLIAKYFDETPTSSPHYSIQTDDYVSIVAVTQNDEFVLVRQFRPAVETLTLELPAGHVDNHETPEHSAHRELLEETGFDAGSIKTLGWLLPDTGRLSNRMWCFFASELIPVTFEPEPGIDVLQLKPEELTSAIVDGKFNHALHIAALTLAQLHGYIAPILPSISQSR